MNFATNDVAAIREAQETVLSALCEFAAGKLAAAEHPFDDLGLFVRALRAFDAVGLPGEPLYPLPDDAAAGDADALREVVEFWVDWCARSEDLADNPDQFLYYRERRGAAVRTLQFFEEAS